ncbi:MAG: HAMP domain-containing sensor histidine kinase [Sphingobium sp.]|nr:MAG: HAMP domain-containing sensor histidine kinase [Sphingobium sp.]
MKPRFGFFSILLSPGYFLWVANIVLVVGLSALGFIAYSSLSADALSRARYEAFREVEQQSYMEDAARCELLKWRAEGFTRNANNSFFVIASDNEAARLISEGPNPARSEAVRVLSFDRQPVVGAWWSGADCGWYFTGFYVDTFERPVWIALRFILLIGAIAVLANLFIGIFAQRLLRRDLVAVLNDCQAIEEGNLEHPVASDLTSAELSSIAARINSMTGSIRHLVLNLRTISVTLTHDLRNYINHARIRLRYVAKDLDGKDADEIAAALSALQRLDALAVQISKISANPGGSLALSVTPLDAVAKRAVALFSDSFEDAGISLETDLRASAARISEPLVTEVVANLLGNTIKYGGEGKRVAVRTFTEDGMAVIEVADFGRGIPDNEREAIFRLDRRLTEDDDVEGNGFGLAIASLFTLMNNGSILVRQSRDDDVLPGATFRIEFPSAYHTSSE